jgi:GntR family transcriptional repressor for pyruvate dehydrogenase complex
MNFERLSRQSVPEEIIENVKEKIISGELKPGDQLPSETKLSEMFGVGRGTIREALKVMFYLGLIDRNSSRNTFVTENAREKAIMRDFFDQFEGQRDAFEMIEVRKIIEPAAAALAAARRDDDLVRKLEKEFDSMEHDSQNVEAFIDDDSRFHQLVFAGTGNNIIIELMQSIQSALKSEQATVLHESSLIRPRSLEFHKKLLKCIKDGDAEKARKVMLDHILDVETEMVEIAKTEKSTPRPQAAAE